MTTDDARYTIRRKVLKLFGAAFHVYDTKGDVIAFCKQKAFKLREDIRLYTDETCSEEFLALRTRQIIDFSATYDVQLPDGQIMASLRRKGMKSTFLRDAWTIYGPALPDAPDTTPVLAYVEEDSGTLAFLRRYVEYVSFLSPQKFMVRTEAGEHIATLRTHFNPFVYRLTVHVHRDHPEIDDLVLLATASLIAAIEGRQR